MIALLIDADNFSSPAWINEAIQTLEMNCGDMAIRRAYGSAENLKGLADILRLKVIRPFVNLPSPKNTTDMSLAVDAMELACLTPRPKLMVIASGDSDFIPLVVRLRERGIRVMCVSERSKMSQDAIAAYDQIIYVGENQVNRPVTGDAVSTTAPNTGTALKKSVSTKHAAKPPVPKQAVEKKTPAKNGVQKTTKTMPTITAKQIIAVLPKTPIGEWIALSEVAKRLHDKKLLAKSATSTKLFRKFPEHFELTPSSKPNKVRVIKP